MDGENNGKPYEQMDDLGDFPIFLVQHPVGDWFKQQVRHSEKIAATDFQLIDGNVEE